STDMPITVAMVEDDSEIREMLTRVFTKAGGLRFLGGFPSGERAVAELPGLSPNVVIVDMQLPGMSGIECTRRLKELIPDTKVLVFTAFGDKEIADSLSISFDTVRFHLKHIYEKLHVRSRTEALIKYLNK